MSMKVTAAAVTVQMTRSTPVRNKNPVAIHIIAEITTAAKMDRAGHKRKSKTVFVEAFRLSCSR